MDIMGQLWEWQWYSERRSLMAFFELIDQLLLLAADADVQAQNIPDCPYCEIMIGYENARRDFCSYCEKLYTQLDLDGFFRQMEICFEQMIASETQCFNANIFYFESWQKIRDLSLSGLKILQWDEIKIIRDQLVVE